MKNEPYEKIGQLKIANWSWKNNLSNYVHKNWKQICIYLRSPVVYIFALFKDIEVSA